MFDTINSGTEKNDTFPLRPTPTGSIIKRADVEHWSNAAQAYEAAVQLYNSTHEHVQQSVQSEGERGYNNGYAEGIAAGEVKVAQHLVDLSTEFNENAASLNEAFPKVVMDCVTRIIGTLKPTIALRKIVEEALKGLNAPTGFTLKIPAGVEFEQFSTLLTTYQKAGNPVINLEVDDTLEPTQTQLISRSGIINLGIEDQLRTLRELLGIDGEGSQNAS